jgi:ABC-type uncharacterized transport system ATPase subunit
MTNKTQNPTPYPNGREVVLNVEGVRKQFPGVLANDNVNLTLHRGEILALLGENGAGKSTLMNIIYGLYHPDEGTIRLKGNEVKFASPREAIHSGIGMVHQHFQLIPVMTVAENVILGEEDTISGKTERRNTFRSDAAPYAAAVRTVWGVLWRALTPVVAAALGLLAGYLAYLFVLVLSTYFIEPARTMAPSFQRLALEQKAEMGFTIFYTSNPTLATIFMWSPLVFGAVVGAVLMALFAINARTTWRNPNKVSGLDRAADAVSDLLYTISAVVSGRSAADRVREISKQFNLEVDPNALIEKLPVGLQQRVEIVKALYRRADILILDEPTAVLTPQESKELFRIMKDLASKGVSIIFITHKLKEVFAVADSIVVMRGGKVVGSAVPSQTNENALAAMMVGRDVMLRVSKTPAKPAGVVLQVESLSAMDDRGALALDNVSFNVRAGEVLGIAGVQGNGQTELVEVLTGLRRGKSGTFRITEHHFDHADPRAVTEAGTAHIPEDRQRYGMVMTFPVADNLVLNQYYARPFSEQPTWRQLPIALIIYAVIFGALMLGLAWLWGTYAFPALQSAFGVAELNPRQNAAPFITIMLITFFATLAAIAVVHGITSFIVARIVARLPQSRKDAGVTVNGPAVRNNARNLVKEFDIRTPRITTSGGNLSGGNQQKMVVAREFSRKPRLLIASQPTRGIDVGSIEFIHQRIIQQRDEGAGVLLVSAELDEIMALADRIAVMYKGHIIDILPAESATREQLGLLMAGIKPEPVTA